MDEASGTYRAEAKCINNFGRKTRKEKLAHLGPYWRMILKRIIKKEFGSAPTGVT
jgi:hypothetical protein